MASKVIDSVVILKHLGNHISLLVWEGEWTRESTVRTEPCVDVGDLGKREESVLPGVNHILMKADSLNNNVIGDVRTIVG